MKFETKSDPNLQLNIKHASVALHVVVNKHPDIEFERLIDLCTDIGAEMGDKNHSRKNMNEWKTIFCNTCLGNISFIVTENNHIMGHRFYSCHIDGYSRRTAKTEVLTLRTDVGTNLKTFPIGFPRMINF